MHPKFVMLLETRSAGHVIHTKDYPDTCIPFAQPDFSGYIDIALLNVGFDLKDPFRTQSVDDQQGSIVQACEEAFRKILE